LLFTTKFSTCTSSKIILIYFQLFNRASDRVLKKIRNYAEIFRNIMRKKALIMRKTGGIMWKIFGSLRLPKIASFHTTQIMLPPKATFCSQANFKQKMGFGPLQLYSFICDVSFLHQMLTHC